MDVLLCLELCSIHAGKQIPLFVVMYFASLMTYPLDVDLSMPDRLEVTVILVESTNYRTSWLGPESCLQHL